MYRRTQCGVFLRVEASRNKQCHQIGFFDLFQSSTRRGGRSSQTARLLCNVSVRSWLQRRCLASVDHGKPFVSYSMKGVCCRTARWSGRIPRIPGKTTDFPGTKSFSPQLRPFRSRAGSRYASLLCNLFVVSEDDRDPSRCSIRL